MSDNKAIAPTRGSGPCQWPLSTLFFVVTVVAVHVEVAQWIVSIAFWLGPWMTATAGIIVSRRLFHAGRVVAGIIAIVTAAGSMTVLGAIVCALNTQPFPMPMAYGAIIGLIFGLPTGGSVAIVYATYCVVRSLAVDRADRYYAERDRTTTSV